MSDTGLAPSALGAELQCGFLSLERTRSQTFDKVPLEDEEENRDRQGKNEHSRTHQAVIDRELPLEKEHSHRQCAQIVGDQEDQWQEEVVPAPEKLQQC